jgi:Sulfotransferase family
MKPLDANRLVNEACEQTGLSDFGKNPGIEGLYVLVDAINRQAALRARGWADMASRLRRLLVNRLRFERDWAQHPEIAQVELLPPVMISCLPRTGSTKLHRMLSASGDFQCLHYWKIHHIAPFPGWDGEGEDPRIRATREHENWIAEMSPKCRAAHPIIATDVEEENALKELTFQSEYVTAMADAPEYAMWSFAKDQTPVFATMKRQLQYLQWQHYPENPRPWLLKSPSSLGEEAVMSRIFPGIRFLSSHRNPLDLVPSVCATFAGFRELYSDRNYDHQLGQLCLEGFGYHLERHLAWRQSDIHAKVLDISYADITESEASLWEQIYTFLGMELSDAARTAMTRWIAGNSMGKHGKIHYSLGQFGLSDSQVKAVFGDYIDEFGRYF